MHMRPTLIITAFVLEYNVDGTLKSKFLQNKNKSSIWSSKFYKPSVNFEKSLFLMSACLTKTVIRILKVCLINICPVSILFCTRVYDSITLRLCMMISFRRIRFLKVPSHSYRI